MEMLHPVMRPKRRWTLLALSVTCSLAAACAPTAREQTLRVMSYNVAAGNGDLARIEDVIRAAAPDLVGLQEVDVHWSARSRFEDQAALLGARLGMHVRFGPIYRLEGTGSGPEREFGLAILSRRPIVEFRNHEITRHSTQPGDTIPRSMPGFIEALVDVNGFRVRVFSTHLDYRADPRVRARQVSDMLAIMDNADGPTILTGDLNAPPQAGELAPLLTRLRDAWQGSDTGFTYPAADPVRRIDYVLLSDHFAVRGVRVIPSAVSDHRPVVADLVLRHAR